MNNAHHPFHRYTGDPANNPKGEERWRQLPVVDTDRLKDPRHYLASPELADAVNVALELGMPLLLTGDPGCGKSRLADSAAWELGFNAWTEALGEGSQPPLDEFERSPVLRYVVHSDTTRRDLFYEFDAVGRFRAARDTGETRHQAKHFIKYNALGLAILRANGRLEKYRDIMREQDFERLPERGVRSVVLIDEIDKAPRDVPNDLLTQLEDLRFRVPELQYEDHIVLEKRADSEPELRPFIIITSNGERDLPPAFLRRCVYFHIELPPFRDQAGTGQVTIERIVRERLGDRYKDEDPLLRDALDLFRRLRGSRLEHKPSLAELLAWLLFLSKRPPAGGSLREHPELEASLGVFLKPLDENERRLARQEFETWREPKD